MKKLICLLLTMLLLLGMTPAAYAAETSGETDAQVVASYRTENNLYSFLRFDEGRPVPSQRINLATELGEETKRYPANVFEKCNKRYPMELFVLIDADTSVEKSEDILAAFLRELMENGPEVLTVTVAAQGQEFQVIQENIKDWATMEAVLEGIPYGWQSDPCGGLKSLLEYINTRAFKNGEMLNALVFTEGDAKFTNVDEMNAYWRETSRKSAEAAIEANPHVIVHTVSTKNMHMSIKAALEKGSGKHMTVGKPEEAADNARSLTEYLTGFYAVKVSDPEIGTIPLEDLRFTYMTSDAQGVTQHNVPLGPVIDLVGTEVPEAPAVVVPGNGQQEPAEEDQTPETQVPGETQQTEGTGPAETQPEETTGAAEETTGPTDETAGIDDGSTDPTEGEQGEDCKEKDNTSLFILIAVGVAAVVLIAVIVILVLRKKRNAGIAMRVTVEYGTAYIRDWYYLKDSLIIGSDKKCDIVIPSSMVSKKNTRIYLENNQIYVEDMGSAAGTLLGSMKLHAPNRLRSGDLITIGNTSIRFLF